MIQAAGKENKSPGESQLPSMSLGVFQALAHTYKSPEKPGCHIQANAQSLDSNWHDATSSKKPRISGDEPLQALPIDSHNTQSTDGLEAGLSKEDTACLTTAPVAVEPSVECTEAVQPQDNAQFENHQARLPSLEAKNASIPLTEPGVVLPPHKNVTTVSISDSTEAQAHAREDSTHLPAVPKGKSEDTAMHFTDHKQSTTTKSSKGGQKPSELADAGNAANNALGRRLLDAWEHFQDHAAECLQFHEVDVATTLKAEDVVGKSVRIFWPDEDAWFPGEVEAYDPATGQHKVVYADGDVEKLWMINGIERVRILLPAQAPDLPSAVDLHNLAQILLKQSQKMETNKEEDALREKLADCSLRLRWDAENMCQKAGQAVLQTQKDFPWGSVVWAKSKRYPPWPSLVLTKQDVIARGFKAVRRGMIGVQSFGDFSVTAVKRNDVTPFPLGIENGFHQKTTQAFQRSIYEVNAYLQEGVLPDDMLPDHNDDGFFSDEENENDPTLNTQAEGPEGFSDVQISTRLTVNTFGKVDFLHPAYHNEKHIWPKGFKATSVVASAASSDSQAEHVCEILESPNGSGPLFRITCGDTCVESRAGPQQAWIKLQGGRKERLTGQEGLLAFGLKSAQVRQLIQQMPGARRCERYCCWGEENMPPKVKLTQSESRMRARYEAEMQQLPEGVQASQAVPLKGPKCDACGLEAEYEDNIILQCDGLCRSFGHQGCAGVFARPRGSWVCQLCKLGCDHLPACALCPIKGGLMLATQCGRWCHTACCLWMPEAWLEEGDDGTVKANISHIAKARRNLTCTICKQSYGACIQCGGTKTCFTAFHPMCARNAGLVMESQNDENFCVDAQTQAADGQPSNGTTDPDVTKSKRQKVVGGAKYVGGTALGDGTRLVCYCKKHGKGKEQPKVGSKRIGLATHLGQRLSQESDRMSNHIELAQQHAFGCTRAAPFDHRLRRGLRAPEALAAGLAKRSFLRVCPYQVSQFPPRSGVSVPASTSSTPSTTWASPAGKAVGLPAKTGLQTLSQRYWKMKTSESSRVAIGKSRIHGWGAITKQPHREGDLVIEYSGELIRPSVADAREQQLYDKLVGAGTYIFRMNDSTCVDATRAGNLAHMLNHSCQPNCYSRTIEIVNRAGRQEEHVVIIAKQDIPPLQELTYDYRFSSTEILPCNCGAPNCCGRVNESGTGDSTIFMIPKSQLKPWVM